MLHPRVKGHDDDDDRVKIGAAVDYSWQYSDHYRLFFFQNFQSICTKQPENLSKFGKKYFEPCCINLFFVRIAPFIF